MADFADFAPAKDQYTFPFPATLKCLCDLGEWKEEDYKHWLAYEMKDGWQILAYHEWRWQRKAQHKAVIKKGERYATVSAADGEMAEAPFLFTKRATIARSEYRDCSTILVPYDMAFPGMEPTKLDIEAFGLKVKGGRK